MAEAMLVLEEGDQFHVPRRLAGADQGAPVRDGLAVLGLDRGEVGGGAFHLVGHRSCCPRFARSFRRTSASFSEVVGASAA